jgi:hypothetical protein
MKFKLENFLSSHFWGLMGGVGEKEGEMGNEIFSVTNLIKLAKRLKNH